MTRGIYYKSSFYDRNLLLYIMFSNLINLISFTNKDVYNNDNTEPYSPLDRLFLITY